MKLSKEPISLDSLTSLKLYRDQADDRVGNSCDIVGSMIGVKIRRGVTQPRLCMTYFVREKIPAAELSPKARIPSRMTVSGNTISTDVLVWPNMKMHGLQSDLFIRDGFTQGTLTAFAESPYGLWGLSCGHCLLGADQNPNTKTQITMFDRSIKNFIPAGVTGITLFVSGGPVVCGSRGFLDCGLFTLEEPSLTMRAKTAAPLSVINVEELLGKRLIGNSVLNSSNHPNSLRTAEVIGVNKYGIDDYCDVVLKADPPGMFHGDSGMLWLTSDAHAAAIHARGEITNNGNGSILISAMSARRATEALNITLRRAY